MQYIMKSYDTGRGLTFWHICKNFNEGARYSDGALHPEDISSLEHHEKEAFFNETHSEGAIYRYKNTDILLTLIYVFEDGEILQDFFYK